MAVQVASPPRRRRLRHLGALVALGAYACALWVGWRIVDGAFRTEAVEAPKATAAPVAVAGATSADALTLRALAARAQQSVYELEGAGGSRGSAFVAWTEGNRSYLLTAHRAVAGILADGGRSVFVERGSRFWDGRIVAADRPAGLALVRVDTLLADPLWQELETEQLALRDQAVVVPAGPDAAFAQGTVSEVRPGRVSVRTNVDELNVGAPVVAADGTVTGVVVSTTARGVNLVAPIELACWKIRRCDETSPAGG
jgi:hypothetical protein